MSSNPDAPYVPVMASLPYVDEHRRHVTATPEQAWTALTRYVQKSLTQPKPGAFVALWHLEPNSGFAIAEEEAPRHLTLRGGHRFSRYELAFDVVEDGDGVAVTARTHAAFPGLAGRLYRALVIGSGGHGVVVRSMLRRVARAAER